MLLRRGPSELKRRLLHEWTARQAATSTATSCSSSGSGNESRREEDRRCAVENVGQNRRSASSSSSAAAAAAAARSKCDDFRNPNVFTGWNLSRDLLVQCRNVELLKSGFRQVREVPQLRRGIVTSAPCNAEEEEQPVRSPLSQAPGPLGSGGQKLGVSATKTAQAVLTGIRQSPQKLNLVAEMVRGMRVEDALTQMAVSVKRAAKTVSKVVHSAQANAVHNFGLEKDRLVVSEAFVGKDRYLKRMMPHGKGKAGRLEHPRARLTVVVKEMSAEQETDLARLRVLRSRGTRMSRAEARLVPHRVLATQWSRQRRPPAAAAEGGEPAGSPIA